MTVESVALNQKDPVKPEEVEEQLGEIKLYKIRWLIITIFVLYAAVSSLQWVQYSIIANIIVKYYGVSFVAVDWTSMISMITYPPLLLPASYMLDRVVSLFHSLYIAGNQKFKTNYAYVAYNFLWRLLSTFY
ncbi:hypothetical protein QE152_g32335 [Popillia japonica]|uniref:Uncharacterized protein n=1 Tax=Popillia japonica TaxID=7064 RepID=A0AAW1IZS2_POPJA